MVRRSNELITVHQNPNERTMIHSFPGRSSAPHSLLRLATSLLLLLVPLAGACGDDDQPGDASVLDAGRDGTSGFDDATTAGDTPTADDAHVSGDTSAASCFGGSSATSADCEAICARQSACAPPFGTCMSGCAIMAAQFDLCTSATSTCEDFRACLDCTNVCRVLDDRCDPAVSEVDCCAGCFADPWCPDRNAPACESVRACLP